jgi:hypothetical protein
MRTDESSHRTSGGDADSVTAKVLKMTRESCAYLEALKAEPVPQTAKP